MAYTISTSDGSVVITIPDGAFDNSTSLTLPGPNAVGYGQFLDQNLLRLLESFASNSAPDGTNVQGQLWFNKGTQTLNVFTEIGYIPVSGVNVSGTEPPVISSGETWFNTSTEQFYVWTGEKWSLVGPLYTRQTGLAGAIPLVVNDGATSGITHEILAMQFGDDIIATFSNDSVSFAPLVGNVGISGFPTINPGLTINNNFLQGMVQFYANANCAAYLPLDSTIQSIQSNIALTNANVATLATVTNNNLVTANTAMKSYVDTQITATNNSWTANASAQQGQLNNLQANTASLQSQITGSNAAIVTANIAMKSYVDTQITITNNFWTANASAQQLQINSLTAGAYTNANVAAYLPVYSGNISAATITATTQLLTDSSTKVATTAFVHGIIPRGVILMWGGATSSIPSGWQLCDGSNGTPDLRNQFIIGAGSSYGVAATGGATSVSLATGNLPSHGHSFSGTTAISGTTGIGAASINDPGHSHTYNNTIIGGAIYTDHSGNDTQQGYNYPQTSRNTTGITDSGHTHTFSATGSFSGTTGATGSGTAFNILPPYYALCYIQKMI